MEPVFDAGATLRHRLRARAAGQADAWFLMRQAVEELTLRLGTVERRFERASAIHCLTDDAALAMAASGKVGEVVRVEADAALLDGGPGLVAAGEVLPLEPGSIDLAVSLLSLHEVNDLPGMLAQIRRALRPDGLFLGCLAGAGTLSQLRECLLAAETEVSGGASPRVAPFADVRDAGALLQRAGFALPVADVETATVRYADMFGLMLDLRAMGATSALAARPRRPAPRLLFPCAAALYAARFSDGDGRIRATFSTIWLSGWAPHASQQRPAQRGSATVSLARALEEGGKQPRRARDQSPSGSP